MMDAFKGVTNETQTTQEKMEEDVVVGPKKSLQFDETAASVGFEEALKATEASSELENLAPTETIVGDEAVEETVTGADDANLLEEGVLLSDSELLDEEWEEGEVPEFMEELEEPLAAAEIPEPTDETSVMEEASVMEETGAQKPKKKCTKTGNRLVHKLLSPRKNKIIKQAGRTGEGRKAGPKP